MTANNEQTDDLVLVSRQDVCDILGISIPTSYRYEKNGEFPVGVQLGNSTRWRRSTVLKFLEQRERNFPVERELALQKSRVKARLAGQANAERLQKSA